MNRHVAKILAIIGIGLTVYGGSDLLLFLGGTTEPQVVTLDELGQPGPIANLHVSVTEFSLGPARLVEGNDERWTRVWVPLLRPDGTWPARPVVAHVTKVQDEQEVGEALAGKALPGVMTNRVQFLGRAQQERFAPMYPGVDLSDAIAFQVRRSFPSLPVALAIFVPGVLCFVGGVGALFGWIPWQRRREG